MKRDGLYMNIKHSKIRYAIVKGIHRLMQGKGWRLHVHDNSSAVNMVLAPSVPQFGREEIHGDMWVGCTPDIVCTHDGNQSYVILCLQSSELNAHPPAMYPREALDTAYSPVPPFVFFSPV